VAIAHAQTVVQTCQGNGLNGAVLEVAFFDPQLISLPTSFAGEPEPPFSLTITDPSGNPVSGPTPPGEYFVFQICKSGFRQNEPIVLYQTDDYGANWEQSDQVCLDLGVNPSVVTKFIAAAPTHPLPCWSFPVCHTTVFIAGPVGTSGLSSGAKTGLIVGGVILALIVVGFAVWWQRRRVRNTRKYHDLESHGGTAYGTNYVSLDAKGYEPPPVRTRQDS